MEKIDWRKNLKHLYGPTARQVVEVEVPEMNFLMVDGHGDPNTSEAYRDAIEALFSLSYAVKFMVKKESGADYGVLPLEGLWWMDDQEKDFDEIRADRSSWRWTAMIMQPDDFVTGDHIERAVESVGEKKDLPALSDVRYETLHEGRAAQTLHTGPFSDEGPTIERVHKYIEERGRLVGKHHEIYLNDFRRAAPEKLRTVIRQPFTD